MRPSDDRRTGLLGALFAAVVVVFLWLLTAASPADADPPKPATLSITAGAAATDGVVEAAVLFDAGTTGAAAVSGLVEFDPTQVTFVDCSMSGFGSCNLVDGTVRFAAVDVSGWTGTAELLEIRLDASALTGTSPLTLSVTDVYDNAAVAIDDYTIEHGEIVGVGTTPAVDDAAPVRVHGLVTDGSTGFGTPGIDVCLTGTDSSEPACTTTNAWGAYEVSGDGAGSYSLEVTDPIGTYHSTTIADLQVTAAGLNLDVELETGSAAVDETDQPAPATAGEGATSISGTVTDGAGTPVFGALVCGSEPLVGGETCAYSRSDGTYSLNDLSAGNYNIAVTDPAERYADSSPVLVGVTAVTPATGIDFALAAD